MEKKKANYFKKALAWVQKKSPDIVKANYEEFERPKTFINKETSEEVSPDISFIGKRGGVHYTDIALKQEDIQPLVTRWKLLSMMATIKHGKLHILAPKGHKMFAKRLVDQYNIESNIYSLK